MTEPKRWIDDGPPEAIQHLLRAASAERPTEQSLARTLTVLGVGVGASGAAATAGAATATGAAAAASGTVTAGGAAAGGALGAASVKATTVVLTSGLLKWGAVVTVLAAAGVAGRVAMKHTASTSSTQPTMSAVVAPGRAEARLGVASTASARAEARADAAATAPSGSAEVLPQSVPKSTASSANEARKSSHSSSTVQKSSSAVSDAPAIAVAPAIADAPPIDTEHLAEEVALVDRARGALAGGDAAGALAALDEYDARFSRRKFAPEALYLRMESLLREGRSDAARGVARSLANTYPKSPHAARARQVLGQTIP